VRALIDAEDLDLVGVSVYDAAKVGVDAGELAGRPRTGIAATDRLDEVLDMARRQRVAALSEIVGPVLYLACDASSFVTVDDLTANGGMRK
jgi:hypothetical protein